LIPGGDGNPVRSTGSGEGGNALFAVLAGRLPRRAMSGVEVVVGRASFMAGARKADAGDSWRSAERIKAGGVTETVTDSLKGEGEAASEESGESGNGGDDASGAAEDGRRASSEDGSGEGGERAPSVRGRWYKMTV
jgi:hypothetical protein